MSVLPKILLVEDDRYVSDTLLLALKSDFDIDWISSGQGALRRVTSEVYDQIILDLNLPDMSGLVVCQNMRHRGLSAPILILSGNSDILTKISLLDAGANDYLTKPFALGELKARLRALNRPNPVTNLNPILEAYTVTLNKSSYKVTRDEVIIKLRRKEFELLAFLMEHPGEVVGRQTLTNEVWPSHDYLWTNTLDVHINHLREKLDKPFDIPLIHTVHGRGYKFEEIKARVAV
jgi:DNA-binding response OmpR family regulator